MTKMTPFQVALFSLAIVAAVAAPSGCSESLSGSEEGLYRQTPGNGRPVGLARLDPTEPSPLQLLGPASLPGSGEISTVLPGPLNEPTGGEVLASEVEREESPEIEDAELIELVEGNTAFAVDMYQTLDGQAEGNLFFSPISISIALAMTFAGADGLTLQEMAETLHFTLPEERLHPAFNALDQELASRGQGAQGQDGEKFRLRMVNAIWGQTGYPFLQSFLDLLAQNYGAGLRLLDFRADPEGCRQTINYWVAFQTEDRILDLLPSGSIETVTRLVLTNAIYFNAAWLLAFDEESTTEGPFYPPEGSPVIAPLMNLGGTLAYQRATGYQAVELLYDGEEISMVVILPDEGLFESFEETLSGDQLDLVVGGLVPTEMNLTLPRFEFTVEFQLSEALIELGMGHAFFGADFSRMDGTYNLAISEVFHKAFVLVDEAGTEAAAATAVVVNDCTSEPPSTPHMVVNRPFLFLIRDVQTGTVLFLGRVLDPTD
ncbi:MAG: serpin family protein [Bradymonadales bacterium]|nr:serpin family protein [Bradymonadales bacterium]